MGARRYRRRVRPGSGAREDDRFGGKALLSCADIAKDVPDALAAYSYPTAAEQALAKWLGGGADGGVAKAMASTAKFPKAQGRIIDVSTDFSGFVDRSYAAATAAT
ncbi:MAG: hypothetical protein HZY79_05365 [Rhodoblastus sp.]|nr:MAG: hypothetical protein HZY79_05365 [Rhodoblastus sp.]